MFNMHQFPETPLKTQETITIMIIDNHIFPSNVDMTCDEIVEPKCRDNEVTLRQRVWHDSWLIMHQKWSMAWARWHVLSEIFMTTGRTLGHRHPRPEPFPYLYRTERKNCRQIWQPARIVSQSGRRAVLSECNNQIEKNGRKQQTNYRELDRRHG